MSYDLDSGFAVCAMFLLRFRQDVRVIGGGDARP